MKSSVVLGFAVTASLMFTQSAFSAVCATDAPAGTSADSICVIDTVIDFTASGTFSDGATLGGFLDIDVTSGLVDSGDLTVSGGNLGGSTETFVSFDDNETGSYAANTTWNDVGFISEDENYFLTLDLDLTGQTSTTSLVGYAGGALCTTADNCNNGSGTDYISSYSENLSQDPDLVSGTLSNSSATPEPSSLLLMAAPALWFGIRRVRRRA